VFPTEVIYFTIKSKFEFFMSFSRHSLTPIFDNNGKLPSQQRRKFEDLLLDWQNATNTHTHKQTSKQAHTNNGAILPHGKWPPVKRFCVLIWQQTVLL
jgi:hypothetical protein